MLGTLLKLFLTLQILTPILRPMFRLLVGVLAVPMFRVLLRGLVREDRLGAELTKDLEQWFRGALLLLVATKNVENWLFGLFDSNTSDDFDLRSDYGWITLGMRLLLAIGVIEAMPDQALFAIIHSGPSSLMLPRGRRLQALRDQIFPFLKGVACRHLDRSSAVFAIMSVIFPGTVGWVCYGVSIVQFLIIGLVSSRDRALDVLREFDASMARTRQSLTESESDDEAYSEL